MGSENDSEGERAVIKNVASFESVLNPGYTKLEQRRRKDVCLAIGPDSRTSRRPRSAEQMR